MFTFKEAKMHFASANQLNCPSGHFCQLYVNISDMLRSHECDVCDMNDMDVCANSERILSRNSYVIRLTTIG